MKKFLNLTTYALLLFGALTFFSCQEEFEDVNTSDTEGESFKATSNTAVLIQNVSSRDGSFDNIVDGASCFALNFPYTVNVNGLDISIDSKEDLHLIEEIFDEFDDDLDVLEILFPITITLPDFSVLEIGNREDLAELARECKEGGDDDDIECIDFVYPVTLFTFDLNNTQTGQVTVESDEQLRRFFHDLDDADIVSIDYPITLVKYDGTEIRVSNNGELAAALDMAKDICDEDDDDDYNDDDFDEERLASYLTECPWIVLSVERNSVDQSPQYEAFKMFFSVDGTVEVKDREGNILVGEWDLDTGDEYVELDLDFDNALIDFELEWYVYELEEGKIKLFAEEGNRIIMKMACDEPGTIVPGVLAEVLRECSWIIKKVENQGWDIDRLIGYEFEFQGEGVVTLSNGINTSQGTWEVAEGAEGGLVLAISIGEEPGVSFEWPLRELLDKRLKFEVEEIDYELILERVCENDMDGDVSEIRNILMGGDWTVGSFTEGDVDETGDFAEFDFTFGAGHLLTVSTNMDPLVEGLWRVIRDHDGKLKVYLNLGDDNEPFSDLTEDWDFVEMSENELVLKDMDDDGTVTTLVFVR